MELRDIFLKLLRHQNGNLLNGNIFEKIYFLLCAEIERKTPVKVGKAFTHASSWGSRNILEHNGHISAQHSYYGTDTALQGHRYSPMSQHHHSCILHRGKKQNRYISKPRICQKNLPLNVNQ